MKLYELDITLDQSLISSFGDDQSVSARPRNGVNFSLRVVL